MPSISKNVYIDTLADIVNNYSNPYHKTIKINSVKSSMYINFGTNNNEKDPKLVIM